MVPDDEDDGDAAAAGDGDADVEVAAAPSTPRDKVLKRSHAEIRQVVQVGVALRAYSEGILEPAKGRAWVRCSAQAVRGHGVGPRANSKRPGGPRRCGAFTGGPVPAFLDEVVWPNFWEPWIADVHRQDAAQSHQRSASRSGASTRCGSTPSRRYVSATSKYRVLSGSSCVSAPSVSKFGSQCAARSRRRWRKTASDRCNFPPQFCVCNVCGVAIGCACAWINTRTGEAGATRGGSSRSARAKRTAACTEDDPYGDCARAQIKRRIWGKARLRGGSLETRLLTAEEYKLPDHI